jgi:uncharacterized membrane protein YwaF
MKQEHHEHNMVRSEHPAVKFAKGLCLVVLAISGCCAYFYLQSPPQTRALIDAYDVWPCIIIGAIVAIVALRAILKSR